jgi:transposase
MLVNALRGHMAELGVIVPQGISRVLDLVAVLLEEGETTMPTLARQALRGLAAELETLGQRIGTIEASILAWHKGNEVSRRLATIPGVGPITASAIVASITDLTQFHSGRHLAAWIGLVPRQNSSGGKQRQGGISKQGDRTLRRLLVPRRHCSDPPRQNAIGRRGQLAQGSAGTPSGQACRRGAGNKTARIVWALLIRSGAYRAPAAAQATAP